MGGVGGGAGAREVRRGTTMQIGWEWMRGVGDEEI